MFLHMEREKFEALVSRAIDNLPPEFQRKLENVDIVVEDWPTPRQLKQEHLLSSYHLKLLPDKRKTSCDIIKT